MIYLFKNKNYFFQILKTFFLQIHLFLTPAYTYGNMVHIAFGHDLYLGYNILKS